MTIQEEVETKSPALDKSIEEDEENCDDDCQYIFPQRLMSVLGDERNNDAICWLPHGRAFVIRNRKLFAERVMPKFFPRKSKYSSFTRKLNRWYVSWWILYIWSPFLDFPDSHFTVFSIGYRNFVRVSSGLELGAYYHEFFLRDKPHLAAQMFCKNARTKIAMASSDPSPASSLVPKVEAPPSPPKAAAPQQKGNDTANLLMLRQQMDPGMLFLLEQQMQLGQQHINGQLHQQQLRQQQSMLNLLQGAAPSNHSAALAMEIQLQKQQQERLIQLQQLMALDNLKNQQKRRNNFRASAA